MNLTEVKSSNFIIRSRSLSSMHNTCIFESSPDNKPSFVVIIIVLWKFYIPVQLVSLRCKNIHDPSKKLHVFLINLAGNWIKVEFGIHDPIKVVINFLISTIFLQVVIIFFNRIPPVILFSSELTVSDSTVPPPVKDVLVIEVQVK